MRYLEEDAEVAIDELAFAASCLAALSGNSSPRGGAGPPGHGREGN
jgi:hypothetical protein